MSPCGNYLCAMIGCQGHCTGWPGNQNIGRIELPPKGCICPPGAEGTCQRSDCGRKEKKLSNSPVKEG